MNISIGAIFRDEFDYLVEWFAWHEMAGFNHFYIADNGSTDGTLALLEAMDDLGKITLIYQPVVAKKAQLRAYNRIAQQAINSTDAILYIDADEFITHDSMKDGAEYEHLAQLLTPQNVGMVGINWRTFGSSGLETQSPEPVLERFTSYRLDPGLPFNGHLKSASKIGFATLNSVHKSDLIDGFIKIDAKGSQLNGFISYESGMAKPVEYSNIISNPVSGPLRINHYVIKSKQEFVEKKRKRGDGMLGTNHDRGMAFFKKHDFKDATFSFPPAKIAGLKERMVKLQNTLNATVLGKNLRGWIDISSAEEVKGWLVDFEKSSKGLKVNVFVNGVHQGRVSCGFFRLDLLEKSISIDGLSGFRYTHPARLKPGDVVEVKVHANCYQFPHRARTVIE